MEGLRGHGGGTEAHRSRTQSQITEQRSAGLSFGRCKVWYGRTVDRDNHSAFLM